MNRRELLLNIGLTLSVPSVLRVPVEPTNPLGVVNLRNFMRVVATEVRETYLFFMEENAQGILDNATRQALVNAVSAHLKVLVATKPNIVRAYKVVCDDSNNPPRVIDRGVLALDVDLDFGTTFTKIHIGPSVPPHYEDIL